MLLLVFAALAAPAGAEAALMQACNGPVVDGATPLDASIGVSPDAVLMSSSTSLTALR